MVTITILSPVEGDGGGLAGGADVGFMVGDGAGGDSTELGLMVSIV